MGATKPIVLARGFLPDDELWIRVRQAIDDLEFPVVLADQSEELINAASNTGPDAIFLPWHDDTPHNDKIIEALRVLKRDEHLHRVPVFIVADSEVLDDDTVARMITTGAEDCIRKKTAQILIKSRICNAVKTKFYYDFVLKVSREAALRDPLTGLWNHRQFQELLRLELARSKRSATSVALLMMDLDRFKSVNDTYGHVEGDRVLKEAALTMQSSLRAGDILARYGGEEFAAILPGISRENALELSGRIQKALHRVRISSDDHPERYVTLSIGFACSPEDAADVAHFIQFSDMALLQAKRAGRDRVESVRPISFRYLAEEADYVSVAGDWNAWRPEANPLVRNANGSWTGRMLLPTGRVTYKFVVKQASAPPTRKMIWTHDPDNPRKEPDGFGSYNSVLNVTRYQDEILYGEVEKPTVRAART